MPNKRNEISVPDGANLGTLSRPANRTYPSSASRPTPAGTPYVTVTCITRTLPFRCNKRLLDPRYRDISLCVLAQQAELSGKRLMLEIRDVNPVRFIRADSLSRFS